MWYLKIDLVRRLITNRTLTLSQTQRQLETVHQDVQIRLPSRLWVPLLMILISMSPKSCSGACAIYNFNRTLALTLNLSHITLPRFRLISPTLRTQSYYIVTPPLTTQRFCRSPNCISKALLAQASNSPQKAIAPTVRMDRSGSGTCQTSPT